MIDKWKKAVDRNKVFGAVLIDLSKAFDCICHDLLIAKPNAYGLSLPALKLIKDNLKNQKQKTKIGSSRSDWEKDITSGVPQGSILKPLFFIIFLCHLLLEDGNNHFANYANDITSHVVGNTTTEVLQNLSDLTKKLSSWFAKNKMKAYDVPNYELSWGRCSYPNRRVNNKVFEIKELLGIHIEHNFKSDTHVENDTCIFVKKVTENSMLFQE